MSTFPLPERPVTGWDLMAEVSATRREVGAVLTRVEVMDARQQLAAAQQADIETRLRAVQDAIPDRLDARLTAVERWQWRTGGAIAAVGVVFGLLGGLLGTLLSHVH